MAYLPNYANDVFISYAHDDDIPRWGKDVGWVAGFIDTLERQLPGHLSREGSLDRNNLKIWKDTRTIEGADFYDDKIKRAIGQSAVMVAVMSKSYFESTYCADELKTFCDSGDIAVEFEDGKKSRLIKLILSGISGQKLDPRISRTDGYTFYAMDERGNERRFMRTVEGAQDDGYWATMELLASEVGRILTRMAGRPPATPVPSAGVSVYLAEVADDLEHVRARVKEALTQQGVRVLPELRLPPRARELKREVARNLAEAALSVHLLGALAGKAPDGDDLPATHIQYRLASEHKREEASREPLRRIVWLPPALDVASVEAQNPTHHQFLEGLRYEQDAESPMELIQKSVEELMEEIVKQALPPKQKMKGRFEPNRTALVYVAHHPDDQQEADLIMSELNGHKQDVLLMDGSDEKQRMKELRPRILGCDAVLILYGRSPRAWAREVTIKARDIAQKRNNPLYAKAICDGPPDPKDDLGLSFVDWQVLKCRKGIDPQSLEPFIKAVAVKN
ncbi:MAG: toll/interleukin-1 receptor domain-containing protein [Acidobacteria bacterium]|nr:toll/interleukin-1 receptor domain-containing protein [Acidobacteriota bacterium]